MNRRQFMKLGSSGLLGGILRCWPKTATWARQADNIVVEPEMTDEVIVNPGMGFETFNSFNGDERNLRAQNYPQCSIAYFRIEWDKIEPEEGKYDFDLMDSLLEKAQQNDQQLALRLMPTRPADLSGGTPQWYMERAKGYWYRKNNRPGWAPDHNDRYFLAKQEELIIAFGERYNGHRGMIRMDIGSVGFWGEWHMSHAEPEIPMISEENAVRIIDMYLNYWNKTPLSMLINYAPGLRYAVSQGTGWRADSMGDYGHFSPTWCHMIDYYPQQLQQAEAWEAWKNGPVAFEPPGSMYDLDGYVPEHGGYDRMWAQALEWHGSSFNAKSKPIYSHQVPSINRFLGQCGYRFVLRRVIFAEILLAEQQYFPIAVELENTGVAPIYIQHALAVKLTGDNGSIILRSQASASAWLPGTHQVEEELLLPDSARTGEYVASIGILAPQDDTPAVRFANTGVDSEGWYSLGLVRIVRDQKA